METGNGKHRVLVKPEITIGNLLAIGAIIVGFAIGWGNMNSRLSALEIELKADEALQVAHVADTRVHYMIASPAEMRLEDIQKTVTALQVQSDDSKKILDDLVKMFRDHIRNAK
jgi:hypothetical protein